MYPLRGTFRTQGKVVYFSANTASRIGGSVTFTEMQGNISFVTARPTMNVTWASGAGYGAIVNHQKFGATASSTYVAAMALRY
jgi:hypothetical protein